jgi:putative nucleotidyltransferase with HDIG domain
MLNEAAAALMMNELSLPALLELVLGKVKALFGVERCAILRVDEATNRLHILKSVGYDPQVAEGFSLRIGEGISGWVASSGMPAFVEDVRLDSRYVPGVQGAVSEVAFPLRRQDKVVGVLDIESTRRMRVAEFDMELLTLFAGQCASALYTSSLIQDLTDHKKKLESRVRELQILNHVGKLLGQVLTLDEVLQEILRLASEVLDFRACAVLLPEPGNEEALRIRAAIGYPEQVVETVRLKKGDGITGKVFATGMPRLVDDVSVVPSYVPGVEGGRCEMACPLIAKGKVLGVLDAEGKAPGCFDEQHFVLFSTFASQAAIAIRNAQLLERTQRTYYQTISSLANALEARDSYTRGHSERVTLLAEEIGRRMGLSLHDYEMIRHAGLLHDIGKIGISDGLLNKPSSLSEEERGEIEYHPLAGNNILSHLRFLRDASKAILHHHERYDGTGYPAGLAANEIPLVARIIAVADAWDAMTSDRPYRDAMDEVKALREILANTGRQFDPEVVKAFLDVTSRSDLLERQHPVED